MPAKRIARKVEALVLCIDRDDDLGRKAGIRGPVIGENNNFAAAKALAMADPEDSDINSILAAIKTKKESELLYKGVEVVTITGDGDVGVKSDQKIGNQLVRVLEEYQPKGIILVTDGAEDEEILPILQSETKILSIKTITVKSSRVLESAYFKIQDFFGRVADNPRQAKVMIGAPGILLFLIVILSYFGIPIVEVILALIGIYLIAKGFGYEDQLFNGLGEVKNSMLQGNIYRVFNVIAIFLIFLALVTGYLQLKDNLDNMYEPGSIMPQTCNLDDSGNEICSGRPNGIQPTSISDALVNFPALSINFILFLPSGTTLDWLVAGIILIATGFIIHSFMLKDYLRIRKHLYLIMTALIVKFVSPGIYWAILYLKGDSNHIVRGSREAIAISSSDATQNLLISLLIAFVFVLVVHYLMKIIFFDYIDRKKKLETRYIDREVISKKGKKIGTVSGIVMRGPDIKGFHVKKKYFPIREVESKGKYLVVNE